MGSFADLDALARDIRSLDRHPAEETGPESAPATASRLDLHCLTSGAAYLEVSRAMNIFVLIANLALWVVVLYFGFLLPGALGPWRRSAGKAQLD
jgi:hypothetical protein